MSEEYIIIQGEEEHHSYRLGNGLFACGKAGQRTNSVESLKGKHFKIAFVESSTDEDLSEVLSADLIIPFDAEDDPYHFDPKQGYHSIKDKCEFYAKLVYDSTKPVNEDGLKHIAFPLDNFTRLSEISKVPIQKKSLDDIVFVGVPSYKNFWEEQEDHYYCKTDTFNPIADFESEAQGFPSIIYNQRLDWLVSLKENNIPVTGGVVFNSDPKHPHGIDFQVEHFGEKVREFAFQGAPPMALLGHLLGSKIGLAPTGHDRYSWRVFDLMAAGCIMLVTDLGDRKMLYNPKCKVNVHDGENIMEVLDRVKSKEEMLLDSHLQNREVLKDVTPERMWSDFLKQME